MSSKLILLLCSLFFLLLSCSSRHAQGPIGHVFLAYTAGKQPIASLPFRIETMEFMASDGSLHRAYFGDKTLDMALQGPHFIKAVNVPAKSFRRIRWHLSFRDSRLQVFNAADKRWMSAQMIDSHQQYVPQTRTDFFYETALPEPIVINAEENHFLQIDMQPLQSLSLANTETESRYVLLDPQLSVTAVDSLPIHGQLIAINDGELQMTASEIPLTATIEQLLKQGLIPQEPFEINNPSNLHVQIIARKNANNTSLIQADVNLIEGVYYEGFVSSAKDGTSDLIFKGHEFNPQKGALFHAERALPEVMEVLHQGQRLAIYQTADTPITADNLRLLPGTVDATVTATQPTGLDIISINGFAPETFYPNTLDIAAYLPESTETNDLLRLTGFFHPQNGSQFVAETARSISAEKVALQMNFHLFNDAMLLHETDDAGNTRLFFLKSMDKVLSDITLLDSPIAISGGIREIHLSKTSTIALIIQNGDMQTRTTYNNFNAFSASLKAQLDTHKLFRLLGVGRLSDEQIKLDNFTLTLQSNTLIQENNLPIEEDSIVDMALINDASSQHIEADKDKFGVPSEEYKQKNTDNAVLKGLLDIRAVKSERVEATDRKLKGETEEQEAKARSLGLTLNQYADYEAFENITGQIKSKLTSRWIHEDIIPEHLKDIDNKSPVSSTYNTDSYSKNVDSKGNSRLLLHAGFTSRATSNFLSGEHDLLSLLFHDLSNDTKNIIQFDGGQILVNADTLKVIPLTYNPKRKTFDSVYGSIDSHYVGSGTHTRTQYDIRKTRFTNRTLYKIELKDSDQKLEGNNQKQQNTTLLVTGSNDDTVTEYMKRFLDATPVEHRQTLYYGSSNGDILQTLRDNHISSQNKEIVSNVHSGHFKNYRLDQAKLHHVGEDEHATPFHYMDDEDINRTAAVNSHNLDKALNPLNPGRSEKNPEELHVLIQLENDGSSVNGPTYDIYQRYPEHTIIIQMNNNGDFTLVNGINNIPKFTAPEYEGNIIFHPIGHGDRFHQSTQTPESLARNMSQLVDNAPEVLAKIYNAKYPDIAINKSQINIIPSHFNMDGCSLGRRGPWFIDTVTEQLGDTFTLSDHYGDKVRVDLEPGITKKQLVFYGASFAEKFSYSYNAEGKKLPKIVEAWAESVETSKLGEVKIHHDGKMGTLLKDAEKFHRIFTSGDNKFAQPVKDVKYQLNPAGFVEYQLPERIDPTKKFHKVFRGPLPKSTSAE